MMVGVSSASSRTSGSSSSGTIISTVWSETILLTSMKKMMSRNTTSINGVMFIFGATEPRWMTWLMGVEGSGCLGLNGVRGGAATLHGER